ncbi:MAG: hypothetical protein OXE05_04375 [Chloroflexi bacterium]|nr:hypothetical protein [Chloroflexota bacterium]
MNEGTGGPLLDATAHSIIWRIRDAARYLGSIIPNIKSASRHRHDPPSPRAWREALIPQRMNRLVAAHSAIEDGFKYLIKRRGERYKWGHNLRVLLDQLRAVDPVVAASLDRAFVAAIEFYGTNTQIPDFRHLASLPKYLEEAGDFEQFQLMRYLELESSIDNPRVEKAHMEFHYEILCAVDEAIESRYGPIGSRVHELADLAFLRSHEFDSLKPDSKEAYRGWFEQQSTYVEAIEKLTTSREAIPDRDANRVALNVCYGLTGSDDLALRTIAFGHIMSEHVQGDEIPTCIFHHEGSVNLVVTTPSSEVLGMVRPLPAGFWLATVDPSRGSPSWFRTERDARLYLAHMFFGELSIITDRGRFCYQARSKRPHRMPHDRQWMSLHDFNWAEANTGEVQLRLWDARHGLQAGEYISINRDAGASRDDLCWCGHIAEVAGHVVYLGKAELRHLA